METEGNTAYQSRQALGPERGSPKPGQDRRRHSLDHGTGAPDSGHHVPAPSGQADKLELAGILPEDEQLSCSRSSLGSNNAGEGDKSASSATKPGLNFFSAKDWQRYLHLAGPTSPTYLSSKGAPWNVDLDQIEIGQVVATGSYGIVNRGVYNGQNIALKSLLMPEALTPKELNKLKAGFRQEIDVWYTLDHPNIVKVRASALPARDC